MERSLDPELLQLALGDHRRLPSVEEFSEALEQAELGIVAGDGELVETVLPTAWLLHAIASSSQATELYGTERQRAAFRVSAHAFDLVLQQNDHPWLNRAQLSFAAQTAYLRSELDPNSRAVYTRELQHDLVGPDLLQDPISYGISCASALLALDSDYLFDATESIYERLRSLARRLEIERVDNSVLGPAGNLVAGCRDLLVFLVYGRERRLHAAEERFRRAIRSEEQVPDRTSQWAAAHLLNLLPGLSSSSIWNALPPQVPDDVRRAFSLASPQVLALWPPQMDLVENTWGKAESSPFSPENHRQFISTPTSGGKTLLAQLIIATHLRTADRGVCYVAPTRSLCREVRKTLNRRLRFISRARAEHLSDWADTETAFQQQADIQVMTPERLSFLLRGDSVDILERFGLFVFDEVHTVGDDKRGWTLEEDLTYLHHATEDTDHRIVLMSAAVGNRAHFVQWMGGDDRASSFHSDWRAPRRMHCIYTTEARWDDDEVRERRSESHPIRRLVPLDGKLVVRSPQGQLREVLLERSAGVLTLKESPEGNREKESSHSTTNYELLVPLIRHLEQLGPVLVIQSTKRFARYTAEALADADPNDEEPSPQIRPLLDLVETRLGSDHPLRSVLENGIAYHHGSLPSEIRHGIEDAVSDGHIRITVATTTMTEGVNLPVRSVVIASQGYYTQGGFREYIVGSRLLNAVGRAGRAAKETEGIIVLSRFSEISGEEFDNFHPDRDELRVESYLVTNLALESLAEFERMARDAEEAVLQAGHEAVSSFLSYVWFVAAELERLELPVTPAEVTDWLESTLAWVQLDDADKERWIRVAERAVQRYEETDPDRRQRWARSGTSLPASVVLDELAAEVAEDIAKIDEPVASWTDLILLICRGNRLDRILDASEATEPEVYTHQAGGRSQISINIHDLLRDWIEGTELIELADKYLEDVRQVDYRFEQLADLVNSLFEIHLPWMMRIIVDWTNVQLEEREVPLRLPPELPALIRWGVPNFTASKLMNLGLASRRFAIELTNEWERADTEDEVEEWVRLLPRAEWRERFSASIAELRNLVSIIRPQTDDILTPFLRGDTVSIPIRRIEGVGLESGRVAVPRPPEEFAVIEMERDRRTIATVQGSHHADLMAILQMGVSFEAEVVADGTESTLEITLMDPEEDT